VVAVPFTCIILTSAFTERLPVIKLGRKCPPFSICRNNSRNNSESSSPRKKKPTNTGKETKKMQRWRIFDVSVHPDELITDSTLLNSDSEQIQGFKIDEKQRFSRPSHYLTSAVAASLLSRFKNKYELLKQKNTTNSVERIPSIFKNVTVVRRSLDARKATVRKSSDGAPKYNYVIDFDVDVSIAKQLALKHQPGRIELLSLDDIRGAVDNSISSSSTYEQLLLSKQNHELQRDITGAAALHGRKLKVVIVGAGPAGLFCAMELAKSQLVTPIVLERGQPVETRGKDIGSLIHRRSLNCESNFAFGEGGAGTWSDGKLTTRIGRNSLEVRKVLQTFFQFGAPEEILVEGSPHLGTDNLVRLIKKMRQELRSLGGEIRFGARMTTINHSGGAVTGVDVSYGEASERSYDAPLPQSASTERIEADAVVIATGHSARDVYMELATIGVNLETKGFAVGFRIEHPQSLINKIQYGNEWAPSVITGKASTDTANRENILNRATHLVDNTFEIQTIHKGRLPVASYRLATNEAFDGTRNRGAYSFCMCPGGQIVPASTDPAECCVNGMSFSRRDSVWANSALVVTIDSNDSILDDYTSTHGILAGVAFQQDMERRASKMGGGNLVVPVQRVTDFIKGVTSVSAPSSSYRLGVKPSPVHEIYCEPIVHSLRHALVNHFDKQMPGFLCDDALLHAVETRTSSPLRISRDPKSMQAIGIRRLFPSGEGAGFAGGIVSAAVDGLMVAEAVMEEFFIGNAARRSEKFRKKSIGLEY